MIRKGTFERAPLPGSESQEGASLEFEKIHCSGLKVLSSDGSSGLVYTGKFVDDDGLGKVVRPIVIKECYPFELAPDLLRNPSGELFYKHSDTRFTVAQNRLARSWKLQNALYYESGCEDIISRPCFSRKGYGTVYLASDLSQGEVLTEYMGKHVLHLAERLMLLAAISDAIGSLHDAGYLYLDLKPANVLVDNKHGFHVCFFDFDSMVKQEDVGKDNIQYSHSFEWTAYEQRQIELNEQICESSDVFSLGAILYWMLTGRKPALSAIAHASARKEWHLDVQSLSAEIRDEADLNTLAGINRLLICTLNNNIRNRYQTCRELSQEVRRISERVGRFDALPERIVKYKVRQPWITKPIEKNLDRMAHCWVEAQNKGATSTCVEIDDSFDTYSRLLLKAVIASNDEVELCDEIMCDKDGPYADYEPDMEMVNQLKRASRRLVGLLEEPLPWDDKLQKEIWLARDETMRILTIVQRRRDDFDTAAMMDASYAEMFLHEEEI